MEHVVFAAVEDTIKTEEQVVLGVEEQKKITKTNESIVSKESVWELEIPKIDLNAEISEGTTEEVMNEYIGHFENTNTWNGNVGLAAHNRGYPVNYFARLKELEYGDEIIYRTKEGEKIYVVDLTTVINDTDWSYLEQTSDSKITLITCVENKPSLRRCVQGIEKT